MLGDPEIPHRAERNLAYPKGRAMLLDIEQFAVLGDLAPAEDRPLPMLQRRFGDIGVVLELFAMIADRFASPGQRARQLPIRRDLASIEKTGRPALLVDPRLQLFRILEMAPASLKRQIGGRVPR